MIKNKNFNLSMKGFSLIELMVAMLIGLLVMAGVIQVAFNSKRSYLDNQETAFIQDNTRYALDIIAKDFRATGYRGCAANDPTIVNVINADDKNRVTNAFSADNHSITGYDGVAPDDLTDADEVDKLTAGKTPDSITLRTVSNENEITLQSQSISNSTLTSLQPMRYKKGTALMVVDANCQNVALVMTTDDVDGDLSVPYGAGKNCAAGLTADRSFICNASTTPNALKPLTPGSSIFPYVSNTYYIGPSVVDGMPALRRRYLSTHENGDLIYRTEEIAQGVEDMQITYGIDADRDLDVDSFVDASPAVDWNTIIAVRIVLTLRSNIPTLPIEELEAESETTPAKKTDGYLRKEVATTIALRNWGI